MSNDGEHYPTRALEFSELDEQLYRVFDLNTENRSVADASQQPAEPSTPKPDTYREIQVTNAIGAIISTPFSIAKTRP